MHKQAKFLGYLGLIPFLTIPLAVLLDVLSYPLAFVFFTQYSAIILSFLGGIHWFSALNDERTDHQLYVAMLPSILAWLALVGFADSRTLGVLALVHIGIVFYDKFTLRLPPNTIVDYIKFRIVLTSVVVVCHATMVWLPKG